jgi:hypothetical protein
MREVQRRIPRARAASRSQALRELLCLFFACDYSISACEGDFFKSSDSYDKQRSGPEQLK